MSKKKSNCNRLHLFIYHITYTNKSNSKRIYRFGFKAYWFVGLASHNAIWWRMYCFEYAWAVACISIIQGLIYLQITYLLRHNIYSQIPVRYVDCITSDIFNMRIATPLLTHRLSLSWKIINWVYKQDRAILNASLLASWLNKEKFRPGFFTWLNIRNLQLGKAVSPEYIREISGVKYRNKS